LDVHLRGGTIAILVNHLRLARCSGLGRPIVQFKREAPGAGPSSTGLILVGWSTRANHRQGQPGDARGDDRYDALPRELFYEQISKLGLIAYNGRIEIHSSLLNVVLHDEPHINS
jgi:hypothetical protein